MTTQTKTVSRFEGRMIGLARAIVGAAPIEAALPLLLDRISVPPAFGPESIQLVCETLAQGCVQYLARIGGWRDERFLRNGRPTGGRLWARTPIAERKLVFSRNSWDFLIWLTSFRPSSAKPWFPPAEELTIADQLFMAMTYSAFRDSEAGLSWHQRPVFGRNLLCRLLWPGDFTSMVMHPPHCFGWDEGLGACILEAHQTALEQRWLEIEQNKSEIGEWHTMRRLAEAQNLLLDNYLTLIEVRRRDLAGFLIRAVARYFRMNPTVEQLTTGLVVSHETRLAERFLIRREAAVLARTLVRLSAFENAARRIGFLDEGYAASQFFLSEWEAAGAGPALEQGREFLRQLEPLGGGGLADESSLSGERQRAVTASD